MKNKKTVSDVLRCLAESTSWHGIPKIASSTQRPVKCLWCLLLLGAFGFMLWQLSELFLTFRSHPVQTIVSLEISSHRFPAVTFCNLNPARKSQMGILLTATSKVNLTTANMTTSTEERQHSTSTKLNTLTIKLAPTSSPASTSTMSSSLSSDTPTTNIPDAQQSTSDWKEADFNKTKDDYHNDNDECDIHCIVRKIAKALIKIDEDDDGNEDHMEKRTLRQDPRDAWEEITRTFKIKFRNISLEERKRIGHQKHDFISRATFAGRRQNVRTSFTEFTSSDYGNCFTIDSPKYVAWRNGPTHGFKLRLNLEVDEYIENFASGYGVRMVFHEPRTFPMPAEEGLTLSPGFETMIGLRVVNISRLGQPFGNCTDGVEFKKQYNVSYSARSCMEICQLELTIKECNCLPFDAPDLHFTKDKLHVCDNRNQTEDECADNVNDKFEFGTSICDCISPCSETVYEKTMSGRRWPNKEYLEKVLMEDTCRRNISSMEDACFQLRNNTFDYEKYMNNFIRVRISFEELNYQQITEIKAYKPVRFVSDIGGAMGLFLGASLFSVLELFQMIMEVVLHLRRPKQTSQTRSTKNDLTTKSRPTSDETSSPV